MSITLSDVAAVAPIHTARSHREHVWGIFSPSQNYRFQSISEQDAKGWIDRIRAEVHIDEEEEAIVAQSKSTKHTGVPTYTSEGEEHAGVIASEYSDIGETDHTILSSSPELIRTLSLGHRGKSLPFAQDYSGNEMTEYSDLSDGPGSSSRPSQPQKIPRREDSGDQPAKRPSLAREPTASGVLGDPDRVICHGWLQCLHSKRGVRQWKKLWVVLRPVSLALYKDERVRPLRLPYTLVILMFIAGILRNTHHPHVPSHQRRRNRPHFSLQKLLSPNHNRRQTHLPLLCTRRRVSRKMARRIEEYRSR